MLPGLAAVTYVVMIAMNVLANVLTFNGQTTGQVSDKYSNLFAPAGLTFSIWGLIYLLLLGYVIYQLSYYRIYETMTKDYYEKLAVLFILSNLINSGWIVAWHYDRIGISLILMLLLLICLIGLNYVVRPEQPTTADSLLLKLPFNVYFGWITVATIANVTTYLVSIDWDGFGISDVVWTDIIIAVGALIGLVTMMYFRSIAYGMVFLWAYAGIALKHWMPTGYDSMYMSVLITVGLSATIILMGIIRLAIWRFKH